MDRGGFNGKHPPLGIAGPMLEAACKRQRNSCRAASLWTCVKLKSFR